MRHSLFDAAFACVAVVILTGLFRFLAAPLGVPIFQISGALMAFNLIYVTCYFSKFRFADKRRLPWVILLFAWPLTSALYSKGADFRSVLVLLNSFLIFAGACILINRDRIQLVRNLLTVSILLTCFGVFLNLLRPALFAETAMLASAYELTMGRPGGFYLQPNDLAINIGLLYAARLSLGAGRSTIFAAASLGAVALVVLLSGSRAGIAIVILIVLMDLYGRFFQSGSSLRMIRASSWYLLILSLTSLGVFFFARALVGILSATSDIVPGGLVDRLDAFLSFRLSYDGSGLDTQSVRDRWDAQLAYIDKIGEAPLFGYGLGSEEQLLETGQIALSSHSSFLSATLEHGVAYSIILVAALCSFLFSKRRHTTYHPISASGRLTFVMLSLVLIFYSGDLLNRTTFLLFLALMVTYDQKIGRTIADERVPKRAQRRFGKLPTRVRSGVGASTIAADRRRG